MEHEWETSEHEWEMSEHEWEISEHEWEMREHEREMRELEWDMREHEWEMKDHQWEMREHRIGTKGIRIGNKGTRIRKKEAKLAPNQHIKKGLTVLLRKTLTSTETFAVDENDIPYFLTICKPKISEHCKQTILSGCFVQSHQQKERVGNNSLILLT